MKNSPVRRLIALTRGLIYDQHTRRMAMFYSVLGALLMAFCGDMFLGGWLRERLQRFAIYWLVCAWLTVLAALLAIFDLILVRVQARALRRALQQEVLKAELEGEK